MAVAREVELVRGVFVFFFSSRRRHTRFDCDWSSDVCSSDLGACSFPIPMTPMIPILLLLMAPDTAGYWQQRAAYHITAALDEPAGVLLGHARLDPESGGEGKRGELGGGRNT